MSSDHQQPFRPSLETIKLGIANQTLSEISYPRLELKSKWNTEHGKINSALVLEFAKKVVENGSRDFPEDLTQLSSSQILQIMNLDNKMAAGILFGDVPVRIVHYDADDQVASNVEEKGLYTILRDSFISHIQTASERKGAIIEGDSTSSKEYQPYPPKAFA